MAGHQILPVSDHCSPAKVYPLATGDTSQLRSSRPHAPCGIKRLAKVTALPLLIIGASISLTVLVCVFMYFTLGPKLPSLYINSMSVTNFTATNITLIANWDINLTFKNTDRLWDIYLDYIDFIIFYQEDYSLAGNHSVLGVGVAPFNVKMMKENTMNVKLATGDNLVSTDVVLNKINSDWRNGTVIFNLSVKAITRFEGVSWLWWTERGTIIYVCVDLNVGFNGAKGIGMLTDGIPRKC